MNQTITSSEFVQQDQAILQQQFATATYVQEVTLTKEHFQTEPELHAPVGPSFSKVGCEIIVNICLVDTVFSDLKDTLSAFSAPNGRTYNMYNPFKHDVNNGVVAIFRSAISNILPTVQEINTKDTLFFGATADIAQNLTEWSSGVEQSVLNNISLNQEDVLLSITGEAEDGAEFAEENITFSDLFRITTWTTLVKEGNVDNYAIQTAFTMNSGAFYDTPKPVDFLIQFENVLVKLRSSEADKTKIRAGIIIDPQFLESELVRETIDKMLAEHGYQLFVKSTLEKMGEAGEYNWLPAVEDIDTKLLTKTGCIYLTKMIQPVQKSKKKSVA